MKKIFPFYKGENISANPLGYTSVQNARKRMKKEVVEKDFEATLPADYWLGHSYTFGNKPSQTEYHSIGFNYIVVVNAYDTSKVTHLRDIENEELIDLFRKIMAYYGKNWQDRTKEEADAIKEVVLKVSSLGYYPYTWKDFTDYNKRYRKFVSDNVEFRELDVEIKLT